MARARSALPFVGSPGKHLPTIAATSNDARHDGAPRGSDRNASRDAALSWKEAIDNARIVRILPCQLRDLAASWKYFQRVDLHKLSAVDATSFAIMKRARIRLAYAFDHHFAVVGFRMVG